MRGIPFNQCVSSSCVSSFIAIIPVFSFCFFHSLISCFIILSSATVTDFVSLFFLLLGAERQDNPVHLNSCYTVFVSGIFSFLPFNCFLTSVNCRLKLYVIHGETFDSQPLLSLFLRHNCFFNLEQESLTSFLLFLFSLTLERIQL